MEYQELVDTRRREDKTQGLTHLPENFYTEAEKYLETLLTTAPRDDPTSNKWIIYNNANKLLTDIYKRRCNKICRQITSVNSTMPRTTNMLACEKELCQTLQQTMKTHLNKITGERNL